MIILNLLKLAGSGDTEEALIKRMIESKSIGEDYFLNNIFELASRYQKLTDSELEFIKKLAE